MMGYYNAPELTAEVKKNGWLYTGDIGFIDPCGFLVITGRKKNVIVKANGKNVFPEELEAYLGRDPLVAESAILGIHNPKKNDYDLVAVIVPDFGVIRERGLDESKIDSAIADLVQSVNDTTQTYKRIDVTIVRHEELPKNTSKKVKRFELPKLIMEEYLKKVQ
jgi:long-chain acyl-CoA synthetase